MKQITTLLLLLVTLATQSAWAQELTVKSFALAGNDLTASTQPRLDGNGDACALVKVGLPLVGADFEGEIVGEVKNHSGEYWVYMVAGSKYLNVKQQTVVPLKLSFAEYGVKALQGKSTYSLILLAPQLAPGQQQDDGLTHVSFSIKPANATLTIDGSNKTLNERGEWTRRLPRGHHDYVVDAEGYSPQSGSFELGLDKQMLNISLESNASTVTVICPTPGAEIYVDEQRYATNSSWTGTLVPGQYLIEARKEGYYSQSKSVNVGAKQQLPVNLPALVARVGSLDVSYTPLNAEVWLDGQKLGTSPDLFRNIPIGSHQVELRMEGYASVTQRVTIEEGKTATLSGSLEERPTAQALYEEGMKYFEGRGVTKDYNKAFPLFKQAAEMGNAAGQAYLSECYLGGYGVAKNDIDGEKWSRLAANQGHPLGINNLGYCYANGNGVEQNYSEAVKWYRKAAEQGYAMAQRNLGFLYMYGFGVEQNYSEAEKWYRMAAEQGDVEALNRLGMCYYYEKNFTEAVKWYRMAAEQGFAAAQSNLAGRYKRGEGVEQNYSEAVKWYRMAAEQGYEYGQIYLGECYENGQGVTKNLDEAAKWYRKAAEQGNWSAKEALQRLGK